MRHFVFAIASWIIGAATLAQPVSAGMITVDFDDPGKWSSDNSFTSYQIDHIYADQGFTFTGGPALRNGTAVQDGFAGALGTYSWRLRDVPAVPDVSWTATYTTVDPTFNQIGKVSFAARRWDGSPSPAFDVSFSVDGGGSYSPTGLSLNNTTFDNSSDWKTFSFFANTPVLDDGKFMVRFASAGETERIMIDNFSVTAVPEPTSLAMVALAGMGGFAARRFNQKKHAHAAMASSPA